MNALVRPPSLAGFPPRPFRGQTFGQWTYIGGGEWVSGSPNLLVFPPIPPFTFLGNAQDSERIAQPLSADEATALLDIFTQFRKGLVPPPGVNASGLWLSGTGFRPLPFGGVSFQSTVTDPSALPTTGNTNGDLYLVSSTGTLWVYNGTEFVNTGQTITGGIPEAPTDGQLYGRENAGWVVIPAPSAPTPPASPTQRLMTAGGAITLDDQIINTVITSASQILTLPDFAAMAGQPLAFKDVGGVAFDFPYQIEPVEGQLIDGQPSLSIAINYGYARLVPANDGTTQGWFIQ